MGGRRGNNESVEATVKRVLKDSLQDTSLLQVLATMIKDQVMIELQKTIAENTAVISNLKKTIEEKEKCLEALQMKLDDLEQYQRRQCVRIFGVGEEAGEDTDLKAIEVARKIGVDLSLHDIDRSHRIGATGGDRPRGIIVKFVSYRKRSEIFRNKKLLKGSNITIREDLTKCRYQLLQDTIQKYGIKNVWTMDGCIVAKIGDSKRRIRSVSDLN